MNETKTGSLARFLTFLWARMTPCTENLVALVALMIPDTDQIPKSRRKKYSEETKINVPLFSYVLNCSSSVPLAWFVEI